MMGQRRLPKPWTDKAGLVHKPLFSADLSCVAPVSELLEALTPAAEDPGAVLVVTYVPDYQAEYWTVCYFNDQSDYYAI